MLHSCSNRALEMSLQSSLELCEHSLTCSRVTRKRLEAAHLNEKEGAEYGHRNICLLVCTQPDIYSTQTRACTHSHPESLSEFIW